VPGHEGFDGFLRLGAQILDALVGLAFSDWEMRIFYDRHHMPLDHILKAGTSPECNSEAFSSLLLFLAMNLLNYLRAEKVFP
jgi:hypothetical protein